MLEVSWEVPLPPNLSRKNSCVAGVVVKLLLLPLLFSNFELEEASSVYLSAAIGGGFGFFASRRFCSMDPIEVFSLLLLVVGSMSFSFSSSESGL